MESRDQVLSHETRAHLPRLSRSREEIRYLAYPHPSKIPHCCKSGVYNYSPSSRPRVYALRFLVNWWQRCLSVTSCRLNTCACLALSRLDELSARTRFSTEGQGLALEIRTDCNCVAASQGRLSFIATLSPSSTHDVGPHSRPGGQRRLHHC